MSQLDPDAQHAQNLMLQDLLDLDVWKRSAGCLTVLEATMRDVHRPSDVSAVLLAADVAVRTLVNPRDNPADAGAFAAMASLAATIRKLVHVGTTAYADSLDPPPASGSKRRSSTALTASGNPGQGGAQQPLDTRYLPGLMTVLKTSISALIVSLHAATTSSSSSSATTDPDVSAELGLSGAHSRVVALRRTAFTLLLCQLQLCTWLQRLRRMEFMDGDLVGWSIQQLIDLGVDVQPPTVVATPNPGAPETGPELMMVTVYATTAAAFPGILLPGCSHLGCASLGRASEAALPTRVCGGCRRMRYCGVVCQQEAWRQGGHRMACSGRRR